MEIDHILTAEETSSFFIGSVFPVHPFDRVTTFFDSHFSWLLWLLREFSMTSSIQDFGRNCYQVELEDWWNFNVGTTCQNSLTFPWLSSFFLRFPDFSLTISNFLIFPEFSLISRTVANLFEICCARKTSFSFLLNGSNQLLKLNHFLYPRPSPSLWIS